MNDDIYSQIQREILESAVFVGLDAGLSSALSKAVMSRLQKLLGKNTVYFPEKITTARYAQIRHEFNGINRDALCEKYGISKSTFYKAIKQE